MNIPGSRRVRAALVVSLIGALLFAQRSSHASDHLDTPTVIADPAADIGDVYAWTSSDGRRLNLVMDVVAHRFSDQLQYVLHIDSGERFGATTTTTLIVCRFDVAGSVECWVGDDDYVSGDASSPAGLEGRHRRFRVFAGLRDDPFFNNVKGTRAAYAVAGAGLRRGAAVDRAGCVRYDRATSQAILDTWRHTGTGPATNFLAGWKSSALVLSVDLDVVTAGGKLLAVWGAVHRSPRAETSFRNVLWRGMPSMPALGVQIQRTARPLIKNALVGGPLAADSVSDRRKESYNRVARADWSQFAASIRETLGLYDGFDGRCGDQWLADTAADGAMRYQSLATLLADDRLLVNSASAVCTRFLAVELTALASAGAAPGDCGGRTPNYDASNVLRSLLAGGSAVGVDDGLAHDDRVHSTTEFPFLAAP